MPVVRFEFFTEYRFVVLLLLLFNGVKSYFASQLTNRYFKMATNDLTFLFTFWGPLPV